MNDANFASLSPSLLARKGGAKPAMRPQLGLIPSQAATAESLEDLGWNDMGVDDEPAHDAEVLQLTPSPANPDTAAQAREIDEQANDQLGVPPQPEVRRQQETISERLAQTEPAEPRRAAPSKPGRASGKRAAFTLRLDPERHLKLRLACTVRGRSAQQIVTEALDGLLGAMPELDSLAAQVQRH